MLRWCSPRNSSPSCATKEWISTGWVLQRQDKTASFWTRPRTPSMLHNKSQTSSTVGSRLAPLILTHNKNWLKCAANWHSSVSNLVMNPPIQILQDLQPPAPHPIPSKLHSCAARATLPPPAPPAFDPSSLLVGTTTLNPWLAQNMPYSLAARAFSKWLKDLPLSEPKRKVLTDNIAKTETWWNNQPAEAIETVTRVAVMMGIPVSLMNENMDALNLLKTMTAAISLTNWLAPQLRRPLKHKVLQSHLQILHAMTLVIYLLTPFTMTHSIHIFQGFRIIQTTRMMLLAILHGLRPNPKLKSILEGCTDLTHLWGSTLHSHNQFSRPFFQPESVYIRFTNIPNMQPKFYLGSAMHSTLDREYSRSRQFLQLTNERLVQAELALRYWQEHDNLYIWAPIPIYTNRTDFRSLETALNQEWQPRLNYPFICQFFHPKRALLKKPLLNTNSQFGLATLWRRSRHKFTPDIVRKILSSTRFQNRLELWTIIHDLGSNTKARFEQIKMLRSNDGGLTMCYALRRLANNTQEPFRTLSLTAIDHKMVERKTSPTCFSTAGTMVPFSKSSSSVKAIPTLMASQNVGVSGSVPFTVLQDRIYQTCCSSWSALQPQISCQWLVHGKSTHLLLQRLGDSQTGSPESRRWTLGTLRLSPSLVTATISCCHSRRIPFQQGVPFSKGIP